MPKRHPGTTAEHATEPQEGGILTATATPTVTHTNSPKKGRTSTTTTSPTTNEETTATTTTTTKGKGGSSSNVSPHAGPTVFTTGEYEAYSTINDYIPHLTRSTNSSSSSSTTFSSASESVTSTSSSPVAYRILCYNVNGLRAACKPERIDQLKQYIQAEDPDILILLETKIDQGSIHEFQSLFSSLPFSYFECCKQKKGYAGVAIYSKEKFPDASVTYGFPSSSSSSSSIPTDENGDGRLLTVRVSSRLTIVGVYVPNSGMKLERLTYRTTVFDPLFRTYLTTLANETDNVIVLGDLNVAFHDMDIHAPKPNRNKTPGFCDAERDNFNTLLQSGYRDIWRERNPTLQQFTYWSARFNCRSNNKGWRLDYVLLGGKQSQPSQVIDVGVRGRFPGTDHVPIYVDISIDMK